MNQRTIRSPALVLRSADAPAAQQAIAPDRQQLSPFDLGRKLASYGADFGEADLRCCRPAKPEPLDDRSLGMTKNVPLTFSCALRFAVPVYAQASEPVGSQLL